jgi:hypothetical protein
MSWYLPAADNDIIATYLRMPPRFKLDGSLFRKMLTFLCPKQICRIPDNNTGAPITASWPRRAFHRGVSSIRNRIDGKLRRRMGTSGSWPNLSYYFQHSKLIESLWARPNPLARQTFSDILGRDPFQQSIQENAARTPVLFFNLLTQKLWLDQKITSNTHCNAKSPERLLAAI